MAPVLWVVCGSYGFASATPHPMPRPVLAADGYHGSFIAKHILAGEGSVFPQRTKSDH